MKKKILTIIAALTCASTCAAMLTACGGGDGNNGGGDATPTVNATVTAEEWQAAFTQVRSDNLTSTEWQWDSDATDVNDIATNKQNATYIRNFKAAKDLNGYWTWYYGDHIGSEEIGSKEKVMYQMLYAGGETVTGGVQYYYLDYVYNVPKWMATDRNLTEIEQDMNTWDRAYGYKAFSKYAEQYDKFTYVKAESLYRYTLSFDDGVDQIVDIKFQDKKIVSYTHKSKKYCLELTNFGTTTVPEKPTAMAPKMNDAIDKTFYLAEVNAYDTEGKTTTDQNTLEVAAQLKANLNKTVICKSQPAVVNEDHVDGVVKGTCVFVPGGAFDDLTGDDVVYWTKTDTDGYHGSFRFQTASEPVANCQFEFGVITVKIDLSSGNYVELKFQMQDAE